MAQQTFLNKPGQFGHVGGEGRINTAFNAEGLADVAIQYADVTAAGRAAEDQAESDAAAEAAYRSGVSGIEEQTATGKSAFEALNKAIDLRVQEIMRGASTLSPEKQLLALADAQESTVVKQLQERKAMLAAGREQGIISPFAERAEKIALAKSLATRYPASRARLALLADEAVSFMTTPEGKRIVDMGDADDRRKAEQAAAADAKVAEVFRTYGLDPAVAQTEAGKALVRQMTRHADTRAFIESGGDTTAMAVDQIENGYNSIAETDIAGVTNMLGSAMISQGLDPSSDAIDPATLQLATEQLTGKKAAASRKLRSTLIANHMPLDQVNAAVSRFEKTYDTAIDVAGKRGIKGLGADVAEFKMQMEKNRIYTAAPEIFTLVALGVNPDKYIDAVSSVDKLVASIGGEMSPGAQYLKGTQQYQTGVRITSALSRLMGEETTTAGVSYSSLPPEEQEVIKAAIMAGKPLHSLFAGDKDVEALIQASKDAAVDASKDSGWIPSLLRRDKRTAAAMSPEEHKTILDNTITRAYERITNEMDKSTFKYVDFVPVTNSDNPQEKYIVAVDKAGNLLGASEYSGSGKFMRAMGSSFARVRDLAKTGKLPGVRAADNAIPAIGGTAMDQLTSSLWYADTYLGPEEGKKRLAEIRQAIQAAAAPAPAKAPVGESAPPVADESAAVQEPPQKLEPGTYIINGELVEVG